jgi:hypothetical protein
MTGSRDLDLVTLCTRRIPAFEFGIDGPICSCHEHLAWFASPCSCGDHRFEIVSGVEHLQSRYEGGLLGRQVGGEVFMELCGI